MKFVCPLIVVKDIERARDFYERLLGQVVKYDFGENVVFDGDFAIHLKEHFNSLLDVKAEHNLKDKSNNFELYFETERLDKIDGVLKSEGIEFIHSIIEQPWGQRVLRVYDYDGHIVEIGETLEAVVTRYYREGKDIKEITDKTSMPREFVESVVKTLQ